MASVDMSAGGGRRSGHHPGRPRSRHGGRSRGSVAALHGGPLDGLAAAASAWVAAIVAASGVLLILRRSGGVASVPVGSTPLVATTLVGIAVVAAIDRVAARRSWPRWLARAGLALAIASLAPPLEPADGPVPRPLDRVMALASVAAVGALLVAPGVRWRQPLREPTSRGRSGGRTRAHRGTPRRPAEPRVAPLPPPSPQAELRAPGPHRPPEATASAAGMALPPGAGPLQQAFERFAIPSEGVECQRGTLLLSVAAGSRAASGHVGFCPPFAAIPHVEVGTSSEEIEATIVAAETLPWGVRVECRLDEPADEAIDIPVTLVARAPSHPPPPASGTLPRR